MKPPEYPFYSLEEQYDFERLDLAGKATYWERQIDSAGKRLKIIPTKIDVVDYNHTQYELSSEGLYMIVDKRMWHGHLCQYAQKYFSVDNTIIRRMMKENKPNSDSPSITTTHKYPDITIEDVKKWEKEFYEKNSNRWFGINTQMTMDNHRVYFNGPIYGSCTIELWNKSLKKAIENLCK